jgi:hypothetical protein
LVSEGLDTDLRWLPAPSARRNARAFGDALAIYLRAILYSLAAPKRWYSKSTIHADVLIGPDGWHGELISTHTVYFIASFCRGAWLSSPTLHWTASLRKMTMTDKAGTPPCESAGGLHAAARERQRAFGEVVTVLEACPASLLAHANVVWKHAVVQGHVTAGMARRGWCGAMRCALSTRLPAFSCSAGTLPGGSSG